MAWELYTTASRDYDGCGTVELDPDAGEDNRGLTIRKVAVEHEYLDWQMARYASGLHGCVTAADADVFRSIWRLKGDATMSETLGKCGHHPDQLIDYEVEIDRLLGLLSEAHAGLVRALDYRAATPEGLAVKRDVRDALRRTGYTGSMGYRAEY